VSALSNEGNPCLSCLFHTQTVVIPLCEILYPAEHPEMEHAPETVKKYQNGGTLDKGWLALPSIINVRVHTCMPPLD
jgi:hypothetical protein